MYDPAAARRHMVESQLKPNQVTDPRIAAAMSEVPREAFVPERMAELAYIDEDIEIAPGRFLMEPMVFARLLQEAGVGPDDVVLDIGCGTGYSTAVLARLAATVVALEEDPDLREAATRLLALQQVDNAAVIGGNHAAGDAAHGPYGVIVIEGAVEVVPKALEAQLAEGGRLAAVVREKGVGRATVFERDRGLVGRRQVFDAAITVLPGFASERGFVF